MPITPRSKLSFYEIVTPIGAGAMGEVWLAKDTKLGREVAIKVLPERFADDEERLRRFEREAKTLATLNHPNVAQIFGVDHSGETSFLVLELVPGESLEERLQRGALPVADALDVASQIAEGLEAAHEAGVIHRDLKPANVRITPDGKVKVLDFGLAKPVREGHEGATMDTIDSVLTTEAGRLLGTPTYMAPEQARGKLIDRRVDVWAFGCVLYECLTARRAFAGDTLTDVFAAVLEREPDWSALPAATPPRVRELLQRCFAKDPYQRLRDVGEARIALAAPHDPHGGRSAAPPPALRAAGGRGAWPWFVAALALAGWAVTALRGPARTSGGPAQLRATLAMPAGVGIPTREYRESASTATVALSPAGDQVAYCGMKDGVGALYLRRFDSFDTECLVDTGWPAAPSFSPSGKRIVYFARGQLKCIDLPGGAPVDLAPVGGTVGSRIAPGTSWLDEETIVYSPSYGESLWTTAADGGPPRALTRVDRAAGEVSHRWPHALSDRAGVLFAIKTATDASLDDARIAFADAATGEHRVLLQGGCFPRYVEGGWIVFARAGQLYAVEFDLASATVRGAPRLVLDHVASQPTNGAAWFDVTPGGTLVYVPGERVAERPALLSREGPGLEPEAFEELRGKLSNGVRLSHDARRAVCNVNAANDKLWLVDLEQRILTPLTSGGGNDWDGVLSPDGRWLLFASDRRGDGTRFYRMPIDGSSLPAPWIEGQGRIHSISYPARMIGLSMTMDGDRSNACLQRIEEDGTPTGEPILVGGGAGWQGYPAVSPDGALAAYLSNETGAIEIFAVRLGDPGSRRRVTGSGGTEPLWGREGNRLYYSTEKGLFSMNLVAAEDLRFDTPVLVAPSAIPEEIAGWDVGADGSSVFVQRIADLYLLKHELRLWPDWGATLPSGR